MPDGIRRRRLRSARRIALVDQVEALLRDAPRYLTASEVTDRLGGKAYYGEVIAALNFLADTGRAAKRTYPLLRNVMWGRAGELAGLEHEYAALRVECARLRDALLAAPSPADDAADYISWWAGHRREALEG